MQVLRHNFPKLYLYSLGADWMKISVELGEENQCHLMIDIHQPCRGDTPAFLLVENRDKFHKGT